MQFPPECFRAYNILFKLVSAAAMAAMSLYLVASYAAIGRPIWIDEFLHFALGSLHSTAEAWNILRVRAHDLYVGQTDTYMIADYWLLKLFGASSFWLRLPSLATAFFMAVATVVLFHAKGFKSYWSLLALIALFCQSSLMYYAGEARPYMPLAAASVGVLAYYSIPLRLRGNWWPFGLFSILLGCLTHAYFSLYWLGLAAFTYGDAQAWSLQKSKFGSFIQHCGLWISIIGIIVYFSIGGATWMRGEVKLRLDPFFYISKAALPGEFFATHFRMVLGNTSSLSAIIAAVCVGLTLAAVALALILRPKWRRSFLQPLLSPLLLIALSLSISGLLVVVSYKDHYWILARQWIASVALCPIGLMWLLAELSKVAKIGSGRLEYVIILLVGLLLAPRFVETQEGLSRQRMAWQNEDLQLSGVNKERIPTTNDGWVALANANIASGGPVWPIFRKFFEQ